MRPPARALRLVWGAGLALLAAAATPGCGGAAAPRGATPPSSGGAPRVAPGGAAGALLDEAAARARAAGAGALAVLASGAGSEGDRLGGFLSLPDEACVLLSARATAGIHDLDIHAYADDGSLVASDESPEPDASVIACPPLPRRLYVSARVLSGAGLVSVGAQPVPPSSASAVARVAAARGRTGAARVRVEVWPGLEARLREHRQGIGSRWEELRRVVIPVDPHAPTRLTAPVQAGRCLDVFVTPSEEVGGLDVVAEESTGRIVARAAERGRDRFLVLCSETESSLSLAVRPRGAHGLAAVVLARSARGAYVELSRSTLVHAGGAAGDVASGRADVARSLAKAGYGPVKSVGSGEAPLGQRATVEIDLPAGCARIDVIGVRPASTIEAHLWDPSGLLVARGRGGAGTTLFACGPGGRGRVDVEALARPGPFAVELRRDRSAPLALVSHPLAAARLLERLNAGGAPVDASAAGAALVAPLDPLAMRAFPLEVPAGGCVDVVAACDAGGAGIELRLVDVATGENTVTRSRWVVAERPCAPASSPRSLRVELRLAAGRTEALLLLRPAP